MTLSLYRKMYKAESRAGRLTLVKGLLTSGMAYKLYLTLLTSCSMQSGNFRRAAEAQQIHNFEM